MSADQPTGRPPVLRVDPTRCDGVAMCTHLAPDLVHTDSWGFPVLEPEPLEGDDVRLARSAVRGCPRRALFLG